MISESAVVVEGDAELAAGDGPVAEEVDLAGGAGGGALVASAGEDLLEGAGQAVGLVARTRVDAAGVHARGLVQGASVLEVARRKDDFLAMLGHELRNPLAAIVTAVHLDLDGHDVARAVRAEYGSDVTLIAMTGYGQPTDRLRAVAAGFDSHLVKPVSIDDLVTLLDQRLDDPAS